MHSAGGAMSSAEALEIAECLRGTCDGDLFALIEERGLQLEEERICAEVDELVFQCIQCSWWCPVEEWAFEDVDDYDMICRDCAEGG